MALERESYTRPAVLCVHGGVEGRGGCSKGWAQAWLERPLVQILVVVANTQWRRLRTDVEKGSIGTANGNG
jgi:hypothetical protein